MQAFMHHLIDNIIHTIIANFHFTGRNHWWVWDIGLSASPASNVLTKLREQFYFLKPVQSIYT